MISEKSFNEWGFKWKEPTTGNAGYWEYWEERKILWYYPISGLCIVNGNIKLTTIDTDAFRKLFSETFGKTLRIL